VFHHILSASVPARRHLPSSSKLFSLNLISGHSATPSQDWQTMAVLTIIKNSFLQQEHWPWEDLLILGFGRMNPFGSIISPAAQPKKKVLGHWLRDASIHSSPRWACRGL